MSEPESRRSATRTFSLRHLLILTALIAIGTAVGSAYHQNRSMNQNGDRACFGGVDGALSSQHASGLSI